MKRLFICACIFILMNCNLSSQWSIGLPLQFCYSPVTGEQQNKAVYSRFATGPDVFYYGSPEKALKGVNIGLRLEYTSNSRFTFGAQLNYTVLGTLIGYSPGGFAELVRKSDGSDTVIYSPEAQYQLRQERHTLGLDADLAIRVVSNFKAFLGLRLSTTALLHEGETLDRLDTALIVPYADPRNDWQIVNGGRSLLIRDEAPTGVSMFYLSVRIG